VKCELCTDGQVELEDGTVAICRCVRERARDAQLHRVVRELTPRLGRVSFERNPIRSLPEERVRPARTYVANLGRNIAEGRGIWFAGTTGTGKTALAGVIALAAIGEGRRVGFWKVPKLLNRLRRAVGSESGSELEELHNELLALDLLVLDDLGVGQQTGFVAEQLDLIVDEREEHDKALVVTSAPEAQLRERVDERVVSRLRSLCGAPVVCEGEDLRLGGAAAQEGLRVVEPAAAEGAS
jgi:DNA replication protein DnaC